MTKRFLTVLALALCAAAAWAAWTIDGVPQATTEANATAASFAEIQTAWTNAELWVASREWAYYETGVGPTTNTFLQPYWRLTRTETNQAGWLTWYTGTNVQQSQYCAVEGRIPSWATRLDGVTVRGWVGNTADVVALTFKTGTAAFTTNLVFAATNAVESFAVDLTGVPGAADVSGLRPYYQLELDARVTGPDGYTACPELRAVWGR